MQNSNAMANSPKIQLQEVPAHNCVLTRLCLDCAGACRGYVVDLFVYTMVQTGGVCVQPVNGTHVVSVRPATRPHHTQTPQRLPHVISTETFGRAYSEVWAAYFTH
jgi:hypothetical protein